MKNIETTAEFEQPADHQHDEMESTAKCVGCGHELSSADTALSFYPADEQGPCLVSGYLCTSCRQHVEAVLKGSQSDRCSECSQSLTESRHFDLRKYDDEGRLENIATVCRRCLRDER